MREGDAHRWFSRLAWSRADRARAEVEAEQAIEILAGLPVGRELAMRYSNMAQLRMLCDERSSALQRSARSLALGHGLE